MKVATRKTLMDRLEEARAHRGWTQRELARRAGLPHETQVERIVRGKGRTSFANVKLLAVALGCGVEWLGAGVGEPDYEPPPEFDWRSRKEQLYALAKKRGVSAEGVAAFLSTAADKGLAFADEEAIFAWIKQRKLGAKSATSKSTEAADEMFAAKRPHR